MQMSLWQPLYLQDLDICCCRCSLGDQCIYKALIFIVADALFGINVSAIYFSSNLQILLSLPVMYNCIYILLFYDLRMLPAEILHPQPVLSITCRYSPQKFCILNLLFPCLADTSRRNFASSISENPLS